MSPVNIDAAALAEFMRGDEAKRLMNNVGVRVRDRARQNADAAVPASPSESDGGGQKRGAGGRFLAYGGKPAGAIIHAAGEDDQGVYVDVGYAKHHPGFYLWWWEVGTVNHPPRPHLRPALTPLD